MPECTWGGRAEEVVNDLDKLVHDVQPGLLAGDDAGRLALMFDRASGSVRWPRRCVRNGRRSARSGRGTGSGLPKSGTPA